jgi:hypothetical protein
MGNEYEAELISAPIDDGQKPVVFDAGSGTAAENGAGALIVRFSGPSTWLASFAPGHGSYCGVARLWESDDFVVVSHGQAYVVDAAGQELRRCFGGFVEWLLVIPHLDLLVFHNRLWVEGLFSSGFAWQTRRLSWDGIRALAIDGDALVGEAHDPSAQTWFRFSIDLCTGEAEGGSYGRDSADTSKPSEPDGHP